MKRSVHDDSSAVVETRTYDTMNQLVSNVIDDGVGTTTWVLVYDDNGNLVSKTDGTDIWDYFWDEDNRLLSVEKNSVVVVSYLYDSSSRLLQRIEGGTTTNYHWDGWDLVREEKTGTVTETTDYLCPQGEVLAFKRDDDWYYLHADALSSTQLVTDENGAVVGRYVYGAWGDELSATESIPRIFENRFVGGLGCRRDSATGLIYMRHRWYDCQLQRFISRDARFTELQARAIYVTRSSASEYSAYVYGANNPALMIDPVGTTAQPTVPTPPEPPASGPSSSSPFGSGCEVAQDFTNADCRAACDAAAGSSKARNVCYLVCKTLKGKTCNQLFSYCMHLERHKGEVGKGDAVLCMQVYNIVCSGR